MFMIPCMINLLRYCLILFKPIKTRVTETNIYVTGKTISIDYALTNSAVKRYQTVLKAIL